MKRRTAIKTTILGSLAINTYPWNRSFANGGGNNPKELFIGTPVLPEYLYENGIGRSLDEMKKLAKIKTVMVFSHDHVFRQYQPGFNPKTDKDGAFLTNVWVKTNEQYYKNPALMGRDTNKYSDRDILDELNEEAAKRDMNIYARILEPYVITSAIPGFEKMAEVDANGEIREHVCFNHPEYIAYWHSVIDDLIITHPCLSGFKFGQERGGPILSTLGKNKPAGCFCKYCSKIAKSRGINIEQAREGLLAVQKFGRDINEGLLPGDGNFVSLLRLFMEYPSVLAWEKFWMDSREEQRKRMYLQIKNINETIQVGWHIDHGMTWDLFTRASWDYSQMGPYSDWLSVAVYFDSMGRRSLNHFDKNYKQIIFGDASEKHSYPMYLSMLGYDPEKEPAIGEHRKHDTSFSSNYVYNECKRAVKAVNGSAKVYARPGFDMPGYDCNVKPEEVYQAVKASLLAGVDGLWCGREWDELKPENAEAFGDAIR